MAAFRMVYKEQDYKGKTLFKRTSNGTKVLTVKSLRRQENPIGSSEKLNSMFPLPVVGAILSDRPALGFNGLNQGGHGGPPLQNPFLEVTNCLFPKRKRN